MNVVRVVAVLAELGDVDAVGVLQVAMLGRFAGLPLVGPRNLEVILQGAVFYSLPEAADAGEELCHLDAHLEILVGVYPGDQYWKDQSGKLTKVNISSHFSPMDEFQELLNEKVTLVSKDGQIAEGIKCNFNPAQGLFTFHLNQLPVGHPAEVIRQVPGRTEKYVVENVDFKPAVPGWSPDRYYLKVSKDGKPKSSGGFAINAPVTIQNSSGFQFGNANSQDVSQSVASIVACIEKSDQPPEVKKEAMDHLKAFISHPAVTAVIGAAAGVAIDRLWRR